MNAQSLSGRHSGKQLFSQNLEEMYPYSGSRVLQLFWVQSVPEEFIAE
jgi:hypothetical protein